MLAPKKIRLESRHWWEEGNTIDETETGNIICFSFGEGLKLRQIPFKVKHVEKDEETGKVHSIVLERYIKK